MDLERERGITIKAHPVTMDYKAKDGETYELNLMDTPGPRGFFLRSLALARAPAKARCLIVDAAQGVEAQTVANVHLAMKQGLTIIPVINKIDLPNADVPRSNAQLEDILAIPAETAILASAKEGIGIEEILEAIVAAHSAAESRPDETLRGAGVRLRISTPTAAWSRYVRVFNGELKAGSSDAS